MVLLARSNSLLARIPLTTSTIPGKLSFAPGFYRSAFPRIRQRNLAEADSRGRALGDTAERLRLLQSFRSA